MNLPPSYTDMLSNPGRRLICDILGVVTTLLMFSITVPAVAIEGTAATQAHKPNIVLIMADDLGFSDIGCYGAEVRTPNIDSLASRGVRFTQFYNNAVCCPTRASLLTGLYPHQAGVGWMVAHGGDSRPPGPYQGYLNDECVTMAEVLKTAGYRTLMSGKWHVGESRPHWPVDRGFDRYFGLISGAANYFDITQDYVPGVTKRQMAIDGEPYHPPKEGFYMTDAIADHAVSLLAETGADQEPFFLYLAFTAPHAPLHAPKDAIAKTQGRYQRGWDVLRKERFERQQAMGIVPADSVLSPRDPDAIAWDNVEEKDIEDLKMAIYAAQIEKMDAGIGRVLEELRRTGQDKDTIVIFLSDNGGDGDGQYDRFRTRELNRPPYLGGPQSFQSYGHGWGNLSDTPFRKFKSWLNEGGIAAPLIIAGPGVGLANGSVCHDPGHIVDLMPTLVDIGGASYPSVYKNRQIMPMEGVSLAPSLRGEKSPRAIPIFWELEGRRAMRDGQWKLLGHEDASWELYDLATDRSELIDLAVTQPDRVKAMAAAYESWVARSDVKLWKDVSPTLTNVPGIR